MGFNDRAQRWAKYSIGALIGVYVVVTLSMLAAGFAATTVTYVWAAITATYLGTLTVIEAVRRHRFPDRIAHNFEADPLRMLGFILADPDIPGQLRRSLSLACQVRNIDGGELGAILDLYGHDRPRFALSPVDDFSLDLTFFGLGILSSVYLPALLK
jgi:hypothetical protein